MIVPAISAMAACPELRLHHRKYQGKWVAFSGVHLLAWSANLGALQKTAAQFRP